MTYRERRERKAERLREWAGKREARSAAELEKVERLADSIPFGQPILVGHHSERRARRDRDRIDSGIRHGLEDADKAGEFRRRADSIEAAAERAIYSDDPDAIERLRERIAELEAERDRVKAYNASCRAGAPNLELLDERQRAELATIARVASYQIRANGAAPAYWTSLLTGNIGRQRKRLEALERKAAAS